MNIGIFGIYDYYFPLIECGRCYEKEVGLVSRELLNVVCWNLAYITINLYFFFKSLLNVALLSITLRYFFCYFAFCFYKFLIWVLNVWYQFKFSRIYTGLYCCVRISGYQCEIVPRWLQPAHQSIHFIQASKCANVGRNPQNRHV